jgi:lipopolysaccharide transport system ATP-binding protein
VSSLVLSVEGLWKQYDREAARPTLKQAFLDPLSQWRHDRFWALSDVNLELREAETIGLIGANGAGKSTLLRLAAGLGKPTRGRVRSTKTPEAILTLGDTFDFILTGRENALSAAIIAGFTRGQARAKLDEIVAFAELEEFIDQPLRTYSDGMRLRLAFSIAVCTEPELLVIDEVLSVGDVRFQDKCFARLKEFQENGAAILFSSHDDTQVQRLCDRVIWLSHGRMQADGDPEEVFEAYRAAMRDETTRRLEALPPALRAHAEERNGADDRRFGTREIEIASLRVYPDELLVRGADGGPPLEVELVLEPRVPVDDPIVAVSLHRLGDGYKLFDVSSRGDHISLGRVERRSTVRLALDHLDLEPGSYYLDIGVYERDWAYVYDYHWQAHHLQIGSGGRSGFGPARRWSSAQ